MSTNLFAYLEATPSLDEIRAALASQGLVYRHTLPADDRWGYPMHVFGREDLRVVYHAGDPLRGEAVVDSMSTRDGPQAQATVQLVLAMLVRHYGGMICDPRVMGRDAVL
jgi:hypothetical protein